MKRRFTDRELIDLLKSNDSRKHDKALGDLFHAHNRVLIRWVQQHGGRYEDGEELAGEAIMALYTNVRLEKFQLLDVPVLVYLRAIVSKKWFKRLKRQGVDFKYTADLLDPVLGNLPDDEMEADYRQVLFWEWVEQLKDKCQQLIRAVVEGYSMQEIALKVGYSNADNAKAHKYQCMKKLNEFKNKHKSNTN